MAARRGKNTIEMADFEDAIDRVIAGIERKGHVINADEKERIAYHESGHALVGRLIPKGDPVHRISIVARGQALGYTLQFPLEDKYLYSKDELLDRLTSILGGRAAELIVFNELTTGAQDDLKKATEIAKRMVMSYGMSDRIGPITLGREDGNVFLGQDLALNREYSEQMSSLVDEEIKAIVESSARRAYDLLEANRDVLSALANRLLDVEVVEGAELDKLLDEFGVETAEGPSEDSGSPSS